MLLTFIIIGIFLLSLVFLVGYLLGAKRGTDSQLEEIKKREKADSDE